MEGALGILALDGRQQGGGHQHCAQGVQVDDQYLFATGLLLLAGLA